MPLSRRLFILTQSSWAPDATRVAPDAPNAVVHVSCGHVARSLWAVIVDPDTGPGRSAEPR